MNILVISHNVFGQKTNMGITLSNYFREMHNVNIYQLYIHNELPEDYSFCSNYYRITDKDALYGVIKRFKVGESYSISKRLAVNDSESSINKAIYQKGRARTPIIYLLRDLIWLISNWYSKSLKQWLDSIKPDVIFLASGDYSFIYRIAVTISRDYCIPFVVSCMDDYYIFNKNEDSFLGVLRHKLFMRTVKKTIHNSSSLITICQEMANDYEELFDKQCHVLYSPSVVKKIDYRQSANRIAYFGGLGLKRYDQLVDLGKAIHSIHFKGEKLILDVYSGETSPHVLSKMNESNGIHFHPAVSHNEMEQLLENCIAVVHTESFDESLAGRLKYSISTKIPETLANGPCLIVYGPSNIASISYLISNKAALYIKNKDEIADRIKLMLYDDNLRNSIISNARKLYDSNHRIEDNTNKLRLWLEEAISNGYC